MAAQATKTKTVDERIVHAVGHEVRLEALAILCERVASPNEIAEETGWELSKVAYHVSELKKDGAVELVNEKRVRGAVEHFYRATLRPNIPDDEWAALSEETRHQITGLVFQAIVVEGLSALRGGTFDSRINRHLAWKVVNVDDEGFDELVDHEAKTLEIVNRVEARAAKRLLGSDQAGTSVIFASMVYERGPRGRAARQLERSIAPDH